jgi:hypothetical protein
MTQQHGRRFEHDLVNGLSEIKTDDVWVGAVGWSGNSKHGGCDLAITISPKLVTQWDPAAFHVEAKKRQGEGGKRVTVLSGSQKDESGLEEVQRLVDSTPSWADPILALKFDHRRLSVIDARWILSAVDEHGYSIPDSGTVHEARLTPSENISMRKPSLENWESSVSSPPDEVVLAERLGIPYEEEDDG